MCFRMNVVHNIGKLLLCYWRPQLPCVHCWLLVSWGGVFCRCVWALPKGWCFLKRGEDNANRRYLGIGQWLNNSLIGWQGSPNSTLFTRLAGFVCQIWCIAICFTSWIAKLRVHARCMRVQWINVEMEDHVVQSMCCDDLGCLLSSMWCKMTCKFLC